jgi:iron(II)-dependent oxidoreductase
MVLIPAGKFLMGITEEQLAAWLKAHPNPTRNLDTDELPQHSVQLDAYYMYKNDVTVAQYRIFCTATKRTMPDAPPWGWQDTHPIVNLRWEDAKAYADWAGVLLPTEAQWEKAARGSEGRIFPWGNVWDAAKCNNSVGAFDPDNHKTSSVGSFPAGASPYGCLDMEGNVWQWCSDWYAEDYYKKSPSRNPTGPITGTFHVLRGASSGDFDENIFRVTYRVIGSYFYGPMLFWYQGGCRCVSLAPAQ